VKSWDKVNRLDKGCIYQEVCNISDVTDTNATFTASVGLSLYREM